MQTTSALSLQHRLHDLLQESPEARCLSFYDRRRQVCWLSREEAFRRAAGHGAALVRRGLEAGDVCVLNLPSDEVASLTLLGVLLSGAVPLLVAPPVVRGRHSNLAAVLSHVVAVTAARLVVSDAHTIEAVGGGRRVGGAQWVNPLELEEMGAATVPETLPNPGDIAALQLTSGTTGFPRVCVWQQRGVLAALDGMAAAMRLDDRDVCLNWTPLYHDMGLVNNFLLALVVGVPLVMIPTMEFLRRPALWLQGLSDSGATVTWSPNFGFSLAAGRSRDADLDGVRLDRVRAFWNAAERIHLDTLRAFHERFGRLGVEWSDLKTNFGCAENVGGATFSDVDGPCRVEWLDAGLLSREGRAERLAEPSRNDSTVSVVGVGGGAPGLEVAIVDADGTALEDGRVGEVALRTPSRMLGYLGDEKATGRALDGDRLRTGDLGYLRGSELFWVGRVQERINLHGKKYDPSDFESVLLTIDGVREGCFAAFGADDAELGTQRLVVVSEVRATEPEALRAIADAICRRVFAEVGPTVGDLLLMAPGTMSKTSSGKRRHTLYRQLYESGSIEPIFRLGAGAAR